MDEKKNLKKMQCPQCTLWVLQNKDFCEKCQVTLLVDQAYADYESENEEE